MKKIALLLIVIAYASISLSQTAPPEGINYQAVAIDTEGDETPGVDVSNQPISNKEIAVRFSIIKTSVAGTLVYSETHNLMTDEFGLFNTVIGQGVVDGGTGLFSQIEWEKDKFFLKVEIDIQKGKGYRDMGTQQLWSVPYALYSKYASKAGNGIKNVTDNGDGTITFTYIDNSSYTTPVLAGLTGPQGPIGLTGPQGAQGIQGLTGVTGSNGTNGTNGAQGPIGLTGAQGPIGLTGATGLQGPIGQTGSAGSNGTNGAQGPIGLTGPQGTQGIQGLTGATGLQGPIGQTGAAGSNGTNGAQGPIGLTGDTGPQGPQGIQGPKGDTGVMGSQGLQGPIGFTGATGPQGPQGIQGPKGDSGIGIPQVLSFSNDTLYLTNGGKVFLGNYSIDSANGRSQGLRFGFSSSTTWTCPISVSQITIELWGGGGGGGAASNATLSCNVYAYGDYINGTPGKDGGAGGYLKQTINVIPGNLYSIVIGAGGQKGLANSGNGGNGGNTSFNVSLIAGGGTGGEGGICGSYASLPGTDGAVTNYTHTITTPSSASYIPSSYLTQLPTGLAQGGAGSRYRSSFRQGTPYPIGNGENGQGGYCVISY